MPVGRPALKHRNVRFLRTCLISTSVRTNIEGRQRCFNRGYWSGSGFGV